MKRFLSLTLALTLTFSLLTACNKGGETSGGDKSTTEKKSAFTMVKFEVNPSFYLFFDKKENAVDFEPLNDDAKELSFDDIK